MASINNKTKEDREHTDRLLFERPAIVVKTVISASEPNLLFWLMNSLASVIACYGLFANSAAVVIGAMVVAMLLGPIAGVALGLNESDGPLLRKASSSLVGGLILILGIAIAIGFIHRDVPLTAEILSRSSPRLFDLIIALAGGAAGAIAVLSPRVGAAVVGVAVATALVPPIAAAGILLARAELGSAGGALLLALTNIVAIQVAFSAVLWVAGYRRLTTVGEKGFLAFLRRDSLGLVIVCILGTIFGFQLHNAISTAILEGNVRGVLRRHFDDASGFNIVDMRFSREPANPLLTVVLRGPKAPSAEKIAAAQANLPRLSDGSKLNLRLRFIRVVILTPNGPFIHDGDSESGD